MEETEHVMWLGPWRREKDTVGTVGKTQRGHVDWALILLSGFLMGLLGSGYVAVSALGKYTQEYWGAGASHHV